MEVQQAAAVAQQAVGSARLGTALTLGLRHGIGAETGTQVLLLAAVGGDRRPSVLATRARRSPALTPRAAGGREQTRGLLTGRHLLVLQLRAAGYSLVQVATVTERPLDEVKGLVTEAAAALGVETEAAALAKALRLGLVIGRASEPARG